VVQPISGILGISATPEPSVQNIECLVRSGRYGCKERAPTFARDAGWIAVADSSKFALLLPEQKGLPSYFHDVYIFSMDRGVVGANNQNACFNWFEPTDTARDRGEALLAGAVFWTSVGA
jgi:hypothetical protein